MMVLSAEFMFQKNVAESTANESIQWQLASTKSALVQTLLNERQIEKN